MTTRTLMTGRFAPGFNFIEVMFAIGVLALGFIMIAGIFPVAIKQTQETRQMAGANAVIDSAENLIRAQLAAADASVAAPGFPAGRMQTLDALNTSTPAIVGPLYQARVASGMPKYAWTAFFTRGPAANDPINVIIVAAVMHNADAYTQPMLANDVLTPVSVASVGIDAPVVPGDPWTITFPAGTSRAVPGGHVFFDPGAPDAIEVYKLGSRIGPDTYELVPPRRDAAGPASSSATLPATGLTVMILGPSPDVPESPFNATSNTFAGGAQDILVSQAITVPYTN